MNRRTPHQSRGIRAFRRPWLRSESARRWIDMKGGMPMYIGGGVLLVILIIILLIILL